MSNTDYSDKKDPQTTYICNSFGEEIELEFIREGKNPNVGLYGRSEYYGDISVLAHYDDVRIKPKTEQKPKPEQDHE